MNFLSAHRRSSPLTPASESAPRCAETPQCSRRGRQEFTTHVVALSCVALGVILLMAPAVDGSPNMRGNQPC